MEVKTARTLPLPWSYVQTSLKFTFNDKRKRAAFLLVAMIPLVGNLWKAIPIDIPFRHYDYLDVFVFTFTTQFIFVIIGVAWFLIVGRKDLGLQILALTLVAYGVFMSFSTLPLTASTSLSFDILVTAVITALLATFLFYIQNHAKPGYDYKAECEDIIYDLHHSRFLGSICRLEGLMRISDMKEPYREHALRELEDLKQSVEYIAKKYEGLQ
ncbi:MAG: hypothetical protein WBA23_01295 [Tunicatimonas sp.]|uniref:hypothetical protein n=1 Tax=Tunicatimonas sp. TaxID=1940096 RepID=UPI003C743D90